MVDALLSLGASITVIDDLSNSSLDHLAPIIELEPDRVRFVHGSILDDDAINDAVRGVSTIFHLAAVGSVPLSVEQPQRSWSVNATGTVRVLEAARRAWGTSPPPGARLVFAASSSAYGDDPALPKVETQTPRPRSPYAASKLAGEALLAAWSASYGFSTASVRYFNIFGPRQSADSAYAAVIAAFARKLLAGQRPAIFGDGTQSRDFTFVSNAVYATLLAGAATRHLTGECMNVGTGRRTTLLQLFSLLAQRCDATHVEPIFAPPRPGDVPHSLADCSRAAELIGYKPIASLEQGLDETVAWFRKSRAAADQP